MRRILFLFLFLGSTIISTSQTELSKHDKKQLKAAKSLYDKGEFIDAYDIYWELFENNPEHTEVIFGVGLCKLERSGEEKSALPYFLKSKSDKKNKNALYYLGKAYHANHKLDEAILTFETYKSDKNADFDVSKINREIQIALKAKELMKNTRNVDIRNLGPNINTENEESIPVILPEGKGILFTSRKPGGSTGEKDRLGNYYQDIYHSEFTDYKWQKPTNVKNLNTKDNDASVGISQNGSTFITYKSDELSKNGDLFYSIYEGDAWGDLKKFGPSVNSEYEEKNASLSPDENVLYFSSNRPDGFGGYDLYKVQKLPTGKWGEAINLGPNINTDKDEASPFIHADGKTLYFSSNGYIGMGGYDIYETKFENNVWSTPENIGHPINTVENDLYFSITPDKKIGYYSSERPGGFGKDDIYEIKMLDDISYQSVVMCKTMDQMKNQPMGAKITLVDENSHKLNGVYQSNSGTGKFIMVIQPDNVYQVIIEAQGYESKVIHMSFSDDEATLSQVQEFTLDRKQ